MLVFVGRIANPSYLEKQLVVFVGRIANPSYLVMLPGPFFRGRQDPAPS